MKITKLSIKYSTAIYVLLFLIIIVGISSLNSLPREMFPEVKQPMFFITTTYPGVSPQDMETLVTNKIEKKLKELQHIDEITSTSGESFSSVVIKFDPVVDTEWALNKVKDKVDLAQPDLPKDADTPIVKEFSVDEFPVVVVNISGDLSLERLKKLGDNLKDELETINGVLRADLTGGVEREIKVIVDPFKLAAYKIDLNSVMGAIRSANMNIPGGIIKIGNMRYSVRVPGEVKDIKLFNDIIVKNQQGIIVYLRDVAKVVDGYKDVETISRFNGKESISLSIVKKSGVNIIKVIDSVKKMIQKESKKFPEGVKINFLFDQSTQIKDMLDDLSNNLITGVLLVVVFLFIFLGFLNSLFVAIALPLSMLIGMIFFNLMGITLNMVVLFGLILALGMLVDNGIVVIENIFRLNTKQIPRQYASYKGTATVAWPIIASTATTVAAFLPLLFWNSLMGEFMKYLPMVLIITLISSLFIALVINPVLAASFMRVKKKDVEKVEKAESFDDLIKSSKTMTIYSGILKFSLKYRYLVVILMNIILVAVFALFGKSIKSGRTNVEFFPETTPRRAVIKIEAPVGTRLDVVNKNFVKPIEKILKKYDDIIYVLSDVGANVNGNKFAKGNATPHNAKITVKFKKTGKFKKSPYVIMDELREKFKNFNKDGVTLVGAKISIEKEVKGPPKGKAVNISISGDEFEVIKPHIDKIKEIVNKNVKGVVDLRDDYTNGLPEVQIIVNREKARLLFLNVSDVSSYIRMAVNGSKASVYREGDDEYDIVVSYSNENKDSIENIKNTLIPVRVLNRHEVIPIKAIADFKIIKGTAAVKHSDFKKTITITGDVNGVTSDKAMKKIKKLLSSYKLPAGYKIKFGGESKEQAKAGKFLSKAFILALFLIMFILVIQFNSILIPTVIMFSVVLSMIGVFGFLLLSGKSFVVIMTGIGIISLAGVVVNNAIVLIDYIQQLRASGLSKNDAVIQAGIVRFRPVMLTAVTTVFGLIPMMFKFGIDFINGGITFGTESAEMWQPMANAVGYGLIFATVLTLVIVPITYYIMDDFGNFIRRILRRPVQDFIEDELSKYDDIT